jgi:hypothetical protein
MMAKVAALYALLVTALWGADKHWQQLGDEFQLPELVFLVATVLCVMMVFGSFIQRSDILHRIPAYLLVLLVLVLGFTGSYFIWSAANPTPAVVMAAAMLATIGWIFQRDASLLVSRKQHTLNILLQMRQSEVFNRHRANVLSEYPGETEVRPEDVENLVRKREDPASYGITDTGKEKVSIIESILYLGNYYEFLAASMFEGDLDEYLLRRSIRGLATRYYTKVLPVLEHYRKTHPNSYIEFSSLNRRWTTQPVTWWRRMRLFAR